MADIRALAEILLYVVMAYMAALLVIDTVCWVLS